MSTLKPLKHTAKGRPVKRAQPQPKRPSLAPFYGLLAIIGMIGVIALVLFARNRTLLAASAVPLDQAVRPLNAPVGQTDEGYWYKGKPDAPVTVLVFSEFQCPACATAFQQIEGDIDKDYVDTGKIRFIFHDYPLPQHANAIATSEAARAAGEQGKFWAMHDLLFSRQSEWEKDGNVAKRLKGYAAELGLDQQAFAQALDSKKYEAAIKAAIADATKQGINATPTYLVDGKVVAITGLRAAIDAALKAKGR